MLLLTFIQCIYFYKTMIIDCHLYMLGRSIVVFFLRFSNWMVESVPLTTKVVTSNSIHGEVYPIHYVIKFASDLWHVGCFL